MTKEAHAVSTDGFQTEVSVAGFDVLVDATGEESPDTLDGLLANYAACYVPALRVGAEQRGVDELGEITIDVTGELNDDDKLSAVAFDVTVEADIDADKGEAIVERAKALCKVYDAVKPALKADVSIETA